MICPNCGKKITKKNALVCTVCGADLSHTAESAETNTVQASTNTHNFLVAGISALVLVGTAFLIAAVGKASNKDMIAYVSENKYKIANDSGKNSEITISSVKSDYDYSTYAQFSPDGTYLYFITKYENTDYTGVLNRVRVSDLKKDETEDKTETIASFVRPHSLNFLANNQIVYENGEDTLYYYNGQESVKVAKNVSDYVTDGVSKIAWISTETVDYSEKRYLYTASVNALEEKQKIASDIYEVYFFQQDETADLNMIYFTKRNDEEEILYLSDASAPEPQKLGTGSVIDIDEHTILYRLKNKNPVNLYNCLIDNHAESDKNAHEPQTSDFAIPEYEMINLSASSNPQDYDELYTSCTLPTEFYSIQESGILKNYSNNYSLAYAAENEQDEIRKTAFQNFVNKYQPLSNNGYIKVTEEVKKDLMALASVCGRPDEWISLCFAEVEVESDNYDYDAYQKAMDAYQEIAERNSIRDRLQRSEYELNTYSLYSAAQGNAVLINDSMISYVPQPFDSLLYYTPESIDKRIKLEDLIDTIDFRYDLSYQIFTYLSDTENIPAYLTSYDGQHQVQLLIESNSSSYHKADPNCNFYQCGSDLYMEKKAALYFMKNADNASIKISPYDTSGFTEVSDCNYVTKKLKNKLYYRSGEYDDEIFYAADGKKTILARELVSTPNLYEDDYVIGYTDDMNSGYELTMFSPDGKKTRIADDVTDFVRTKKNNIFYISDKDLYCYDGKSKKVICSDVDKIWAKEKNTLMLHDTRYIDE